MPGISDLANAIAVAEGSAAGLSVGSRQNNPGDVKCGSLASAYGCQCAANGFAACPDAASGTALQTAVLQGYAGDHPGWTLEQALNTYAGDPGDGYIETVADQLGVPPSATLGQLFDGASAPSTLSLSVTGAVAPAAPSPWLLIAAVAAAALLLVAAAE